MAEHAINTSSFYDVLDLGDKNQANSALEEMRTELLFMRRNNAGNNSRLSWTTDEQLAAAEAVYAECEKLFAEMGGAK